MLSSRIPVSVSAKAIMRPITRRPAAVLPCRIPRPLKSATVRRYSRIAIASRPIVKDAASPAQSVSPVKCADIVEALATMSISTDNPATSLASSDSETKPSAQVKKPTPCQLIVGRRRPYPTRTLSSTARASAAAKIAERRERVVTRITSTSSSRSSSRQSSPEVVLATANPRRHIRYQRIVGSEGLTEYCLLDYVFVSNSVLTTGSRIPTRSIGCRPLQTRSRLVSPTSCRILMTLTREVSQRGLEPFNPGQACMFRSTTYCGSSIHLDNYYDREERTHFCPYHDDDDEAADNPHILPRLWATSAAEAAVNPHRPRKVRFAKGLVSSLRFFKVYPWIAVDTSREPQEGDKWDLQNSEFLAQTKANTTANTHPTLDDDIEIQAVNTKFGRRYERRQLTMSDADALWAENKAKIEKILAEWTESSDSD